MNAILSGLLGAVMTGLAAHAAAPFTLKPAIETSAATLSLADLVEGATVPREAIFGAPEPGKTGTIKTARIAAALKAATGQTLAPTKETHVQVTRRARIIAEADLVQELGRMIARDYRIADPEVRLAKTGATADRVVEDTATGPIVIDSLLLDPQSLRFEAQIRIADSAQLRAKPLVVTGIVAADRLVPVLNTAIEKGNPIGPADIRMEKRLRSSVQGKTVLTQSDLQNRVALADLAAGDVLTGEVAGKPILVEKNSFVTVTYEANGLLLSMRGRANEAGHEGDVIGFTNPQSKKVLFGEVTGQGQLRVTQWPGREALLDTRAPSAPLARPTVQTP